MKARRTQPLAAVFSLTEFPSEKAHVGALTGMANALAKAGHSVQLYAFFRPRAEQMLREKFELATAVRVGWSSRHLGRAGKALSVAAWAIIVATRRHDTILTRSAFIALASRRSKRVILELHQEVPIGRIKNLALRSVFRFLRSSHYQFVFISDSLLQHFRATVRNLDPSKCVVSPSGYRREWFPEHWSPSPGDRIVTYAGSLYSGRGIDLVLSIAGRVPSAEFRIVGGTPSEWLLLTTERDVAANCVHIPHVAPKSVAQFLIQSDVLIAPYQQSVYIASGADIGRVISPLKLAEYLAAGRAIVASSLPAIRTVVTDAQTAILVPCDDVDAWSDAIQRLLDDRRFRDSLGERGFHYARENLNWDRRLARIMSRVSR